MRIALAFAATALALTTAGCSGSISVGGDVSAEDLAKEVSSQLEAQVGEAPDEVKCPEDLKAEVDATAECVLTDAGVDYAVTVTVTSVKDGTASFDIVVDDQPIE